MMPDPTAGETKPKRIVMMLHDLRGGGAERVNLRLLRSFRKMGHEVELVLVSRTGAYAGEVPDGVRVTDLGKSNVFKAVPQMARYLRAERPASVLTGLTHMNIAVLMAKLWARSAARIIVVEHNQISMHAARAQRLRAKITYRLVPFFYRFAEKVVAVSEGVASDVRNFTGLRGEKVVCIYNPIFDQSILKAANDRVDDSWLNDASVPVIVAVGRLHRQKGFDILLNSFAALRAKVPVRLIILGEGEERPALEQMIDALGIAPDVRLAGFADNPYAMLARADLFVLSSRWEGLPTVIVEALACGAKVVATDCPSGPREILADGKYGRLVPVENVEALTTAMFEALNAPSDDYSDRAREYDADLAARNYSAVCL